MSKLSVFAEKLTEAGWLAAIVLAPLFFNVYSSRVFEPDKISLVRSIALVMAVAWLVRWLDQWRLTTRAERLAAPRFPQNLRLTVATWSRENPLVLVTLLLVLAYLISTLASVSPSVSLLGSYQRLEGTYTTFSYILIFFLAANLIRSQAQIDRVINTAIAVGFPVAFYGVIQHYFLDPLPWGGDTTTRVASNMGNSIFVGAFLIMVTPLALARLVEHARRASGEWPAGLPRALIAVAAATSVAVVGVAWALSFDLGAKKIIDAGWTGALTPEMLRSAVNDFHLALLITVLVVVAWALLALYRPRSPMQENRVGTYLLIGVYAVVLAVQFACLLFSQSRGPLLGLLVGLFVFGVLYAISRRARLFALASVTLAAFGILFLIAFNTVDAAPLTNLRNSPYLGRLGRVFDTNDGTTQVRILIWEGSLQLVLPHTPLWSPTTGDDVLNPIRPLIGYGPESMYIAYNRFYPPDLGHIESRNASPDRSHNETFDVLVTTGLVGFVIYIALFLSIFYYALKWLGFISGPRQRNLFIGLWLAGALGFALLFGLTLGWNFVGVAVPAGMITGFLVYVSGFALLRGRTAVLTDPARALWITALLAAIVAHFVEINFGIAIVASNTYFWTLTALLIAVGTGRVAELKGATPEAVPAIESSPVAALARPRTDSTGRTRKRVRREGAEPGPRAAGRIPAEAVSVPVAPSFLVGLMLATMAYTFVTTQMLTVAASAAGPLNVVTSALTLRQTTAGNQPSPVMVWLFLATLAIAAIIFLAEWGRTVRIRKSDWLAASALFIILALAILTSFLLYHTLLLTSDSTRLAQAILATIEMFTFFVLIMLIVTGAALLFDLKLPEAWVAREWNWAAAPLLALVAFFLIGATNINVVQGDIRYKQAQSFEGSGQWDNAIALYTTALQRQPTQDYYLLFLGRAYLESSRSLTDPTQRELRLQEAERVLLEARAINPLNTDHSANLGRLHRAWAGMTSDPAAAEQHFQKSIDYYGQAIRLSPNTAYLYNEMAEVLLTHGDRAQALDKLQTSLSLDQHYVQTRLYLGEYYRTGGDLPNAAEQYLAALLLDPNALSSADGFPLQEPLDVLAKSDRATEALGIWSAALVRDPASIGVRLARGDLYRRMGQTDQARQELEQAVRLAPKNLLALTMLANFYSENGEIDKAIAQVQAALAVIPADRPADQSRYQNFLGGLQQLRDALAAVAKNPNDLEARRKVARLWYDRGQPDRAAAEYQRILALKADSYDDRRALALIEVQLNQLDRAASDLDLALRLAPDKDKDFFTRLQAVVDLARRGDKAAALPLAQDLLKQVGSDVPAANALNALIAELQKK